MAQMFVVSFCSRHHPGAIRFDFYTRSAAEAILTEFQSLLVDMAPTMMLVIDGKNRMASLDVSAYACVMLESVTIIPP